MGAFESMTMSAKARDGKGGLAPATVIYMHGIIKHALAQAVRWEVLSRSPAEAVDPGEPDGGGIL